MHPQIPLPVTNRRSYVHRAEITAKTTVATFRNVQTSTFKTRLLLPPAAHGLPRRCRPCTVWNAYPRYAFQCGMCHVLRDLARRRSPTGNTETFLYRGKRGETPKLTGSSCHCLRPVGSKLHFRGSTATRRTNVSVVPFFCCDRRRLAKVREETAFALQR
ncbi:unnamed protein product [Ixodes pacificus]